ncbi:MAG: histidine ammonia-lyase [Chloroflexota bacterium]|nr:histidine ammonia-lyase [Chloroflexota bacterium]
MTHSPTSLDGEHLTLDDVVAVARAARPVVLADAARPRIDASRAWVDQLLARGAPIVYGINTGFGAFANVPIHADQSARLMRNLILSHSAGVGDPLAEEIVRATMAIRANTLAKGFSGVRAVVIETLIEMLNRGVHPIIPAKGSVGASGDLAPLSHLVLVMTRDAQDKEEESGEAIFRGERVSGKRAMELAGIPRIELQAKEGLALNNGATVSAAIAALAIADAENLARHADLALALSLEALRGRSAPFDARIHRAAGHAGQIETAQNVRALIAGSRLIDSTSRVQDAYSFRCAPQVIGAARDAIAYARKIVTEEINAATDNPLIFLDLEDDNKSRSGGNFHGESIALATNLLAIAVAEIGSIAERRVFRLISAHLSDGLPMMLVEGGGANSGLMMAQVTAAALVSDSKTLAHPDSVDSIPTSADQEDHVSMSANAARHAREIVWNTTRILAIELIAAAQGIDLRLKNLGQGVEMLGRGTRAAHAHIRRVIPFLDRDRVLAGDIEKAVEAIEDRRWLGGSVIG